MGVLILDGPGPSKEQRTSFVSLTTSFHRPTVVSLRTTKNNPVSVAPVRQLYCKFTNLSKTSIQLLRLCFMEKSKYGLLQLLQTVL
jgi:hypothetical protein